MGPEGRPGPWKRLAACTTVEAPVDERGFVKARLLVIALVGAALVALPAGALGSASRTATNAQSFADSIGEDANAPDITGVDVSNDDAGLITFHVKISNRPAITPDMVVLLFMDTDKNPATGDTQSLGAD